MKQIILPDELTAQDIQIMATRLWAKVNKNGPTPAHRPDLGPCWEWVAGLYKNGYGGLKYYNKAYRAHRLSWFLEYGRWPEPMALHHCDNRVCVRPSHLFEGDNTANMQDAARKGVFANSERMKKVHEANMRRSIQRVMDGMAC